MLQTRGTSTQYNNANPEARDILLEGKILISRDENIEFLFSQR